MMDIFSSQPEDRENLSENEKFLQVQLRFEKLVRYTKLDIKRKQEKRVYISPRER